jgi:hypothetical protein
VMTTKILPFNRFYVLRVHYIHNMEGDEIVKFSILSYRVKPSFTGPSLVHGMNSKIALLRC